MRAMTPVVVVALAAAPGAAGGPAWPQPEANPLVIRLAIPPVEESAGGLMASDLDGDGRPEILVASPGHVAAHRADGRALWTLRVDVRLGGPSESRGLPGHHAPGLQAGDIDGDGRIEVVLVDRKGAVHVFRGASGEPLWRARPPAPRGAEGWEHAVIACFRGRGDRDILLQATNREGYRMGRHLAAYAAEALRAGGRPLWRRDDFLACAHNGARVADLDGDGRDEVLGGTIVGPEGRIRARIPLRGHIDSIFVADVRPDLAGLEVVALEEGGGNRIFLYGLEGLIWQAHHRHQEPQNAAIGVFDPRRPGLEIWCRSRYDEHQKPFTFDARGKLVADYEMDRVAPKGWTVRGVEVIHTIDWTGGPAQLAAAKERHRSGDVAIFEPVSGRFVARFREKADRLYVADVSGDWREELIVLAGGEIRIYHNPAPNPRPDRPRLWRLPHYRRSKMTWNYYSP